VELVDMTLQTAGPEAALACLDRIPPEERNRPACRLAWLEISGRLGDWKQVVSLSAAAAEDPGYSTEQQIVLALWQVRGFKELGQQGGADTSLQRALKLSDGRPMFAFRAGARLLDWKLPQAARPLLEQAIRGSDAGIRDPALRHLIAIAESQGDAVAGLASAEQLLKLAPADVFARQSVAWYLLVTQGSAERARLMLADVQRSVPDAEPLREPLALLALRKGEPGVAVTNYMALAQGPRNHSSRVYFAASLAALGRTNDARAMLATVNPALLYTVARTEQDELVKGLGVKP
jgi:hypothetical protein